VRLAKGVGMAHQSRLWRLPHLKTIYKTAFFERERAHGAEERDKMPPVVIGLSWWFD